MIDFKQGNLLEEDVQALVNTVNCVGVMGKGIALQFKQAFPENFRQYAKACRAGEVEPGRMFIVSRDNLFNPRYIINFPTKRHWRNNSRIEDIERGMEDLILQVKQLEIKSIAIPPLGCGNGGLDWQQVKPAIESAFATLPDVKVVVFTPQGRPAADTMKVSTSKPNMTRGRALLIRLLELYEIPGYRLSLLEIQKLAYFLQAGGEALKLRYIKYKYGPYADNLNHVLQRIEGHFIRGYGDRAGGRNTEIYVLPEGRKAAQSFLEASPDAIERLTRVGNLITGFETPYGMEMMATVHWVARENPQAATDVEVAIAKFQEWNERKRNLFKPQHIEKAWHRLQEQNWL